MIAEEHCGDVRLLDQHAGPWERLCAESSGDEPFYRPDWIAAYLKAFEPGASIVLATVKAKDRLLALLPLVNKRTLFCGLPARMLQGPANAHSSRFDLLRAAGEEGSGAVAALWTHLKQRKGWDVLELPLVAEGAAAEQLIGMAREEGYKIGHFESDHSPYVPLLPGVAPDQIPLNSHFRQNLRRRMRKARASFEVRLRRIENPEPADLSRFYDLENSGWKGKNNTAIASSETTRRFYDQIARTGSKHGYFTLYLMEFGDTLVGGHFGLVYKNRYYSPKVAYDESYSTYGPGHLIVLSILEDILPRGFQEFDFLGPWMDWKGEWTTKGRKHTFWYIFQRGLYGDALHAAKMKAEPVARQVVRRIRKAREERRMAAEAAAKQAKEAGQ